MAHFRGFWLETSLVLLSAVVLLPRTGHAAATASRHLGEQCDSNGLCVDENTSCFSGICGCNKDYVNSSNVCYKVVDMWQGPCSVTEQCDLFKDAVCQDGSCQCMQSHHFLDGQCWTTRYLKDECSNDNECYLAIHPNRIECMHNVCNCKDEYEINFEGNDCNGGNKLWSLGIISLLLIQLSKQLLN